MCCVIYLSTGAFLKVIFEIDMDTFKYRSMDVDDYARRDFLVFQMYDVYAPICVH